MQSLSIKGKINQFFAVIVKKFRTLFLDPVGVYYKCKKIMRIIFIKLIGGIPPIYGEDYDMHWNFTSFKDKIILDLGADYGSTAYYFLRKKAKKIIAVEGDPQLASKLRLHFQNDKDKVIPIEDFIDSPKKIEKLISEYNPNLVKVDIEGSEKYLLEVDNVEQVDEWLIEAHSEEIYQALYRFLVEHNFYVRSFRYLGNVKIIYASKMSK
ncbi:MAG: hypothetical protein NZ926_02705 [Candidatus Methanomethylicia archaeon]|nr:hypothetical protein [Candidatus Methanomethylicia archaeon]MDW7989040.1 hypothetical protein [Nitrososphaerota archaeon]